MKNLVIKILELGSLNTNCYLVWDKKTFETIVIDPADSGDLISEEILQNNLKLKNIILTHGHFDHVLGLLELKLNFPKAKILLHSQDLFLLKNSQQSAWHWLNRQTDPVPLPDEFLADGDILKLGKIDFRIMHAPGHTPGSICLYSKDSQTLFSGDLLFKNAIGKTDFSYSNPNKMQNSLKKIFKLPKETLVYPGHGETTMIGQER